MPLPDFLVIGAQKAGTTWLRRGLRKHPDISMPPVKATRYFLHRGTGTSNLRRAFATDGSGVRYRSMLRRCARAAVSNPHEARWWFRFLLRRQDDTWYASLFEPADGQIAGEVTPAYSRLGEEEVEPIAQLMPGLKVVYLIRNPVDRTWSQLAMRLEKDGVELGAAADERLDLLARHEQVIRNSDAATTLRIWRTAFGREQVFVGFFDALREDPRGLLASVFTFLNVDPAPASTISDVEQPRNAREYPPIPDEFRHRLLARWDPTIRELHTEFDNEYTARWVESLDAGRIE